jgi:hypothetical protein
MTPHPLSPSARLAFETSLDVAKEHLVEREYSAAWLALERAHVLGQSSVWLHVRSHWWMLVCGLAEKNVSEMVGQIVRLALSIPGSALGRYPRGNTGRANVDMFRPMRMAPDLEGLLGTARAQTLSA